MFYNLRGAERHTHEDCSGGSAWRFWPLEKDLTERKDNMATREGQELIILSAAIAFGFAGFSSERRIKS